MTRIYKDYYIDEKRQLFQGKRLIREFGAYVKASEIMNWVDGYENGWSDGNKYSLQELGER